jgi:AbrB family looped-hinge helix DNA binding protein
MGAHEPITTVVSTKGQVILPKAIRDLRHWPAGTRLMVEDTPEGVLLKAVPIFPETDLDMVFGSMRHDGPVLSVEDMDEVIAKEARRRASD